MKTFSLPTNASPFTFSKVSRDDHWIGLTGSASPVACARCGRAVTRAAFFSFGGQTLALGLDCYEEHRGANAGKKAEKARKARALLIVSIRTLSADLDTPRYAGDSDRSKAVIARDLAAYRALLDGCGDDTLGSLIEELAARL